MLPPQWQALAEMLVSTGKGIGYQPSGKAQHFDCCIHWFESSMPCLMSSHWKTPFNFLTGRPQFKGKTFRPPVERLSVRIRYGLFDTKKFVSCTVLADIRWTLECWFSANAGISRGSIPCAPFRNQHRDFGNQPKVKTKITF